MIDHAIAILRLIIIPRKKDEMEVIVIRLLIGTGMGPIVIHRVDRVMMIEIGPPLIVRIGIEILGTTKSEPLLILVSIQKTAVPMAMTEAHPMVGDLVRPTVPITLLPRNLVVVERGATNSSWLHKPLLLITVLFSCYQTLFSR